MSFRSVVHYTARLCLTFGAATALLLLTQQPFAATPNYNATHRRESASPPSYSVIRIPLPAHWHPDAELLNDQGEVVIDTEPPVQNGDALLHIFGGVSGSAFVWQHGRTHQLSGKSPDGLNNRGQVLLDYMTTAPAAAHTVILNSNLRPVFQRHATRGAFMDFQGSLSVLNDRGEFASAYIYHILPDVEDVIVWDHGHPHPTDCNRQAAKEHYGSGRAVALNNRGTVLISLHTTNDAFMKDRSALVEGGRFRFLPLPQGNIKYYAAMGWALSNRDAVAGSVTLAVPVRTEVKRAVLWESEAAHLLPPPAGSQTAEAQGVNDAGEVVGWSGGVTDTDSESHPHACLWSEGRVVDLNECLPPGSGWTLEFASGINNRGQICGTGMFHGKEAVFLLTPQHH